MLGSRGKQTINHRKLVISLGPFNMRRVSKTKGRQISGWRRFALPSTSGCRISPSYEDKAFKALVD